MSRVYSYSKNGNRQILSCLFLFFHLGLVPAIYAQDIEQLTKKGKFKITGGANANQTIYMQDGGTNRRDPYNYFLSGRMVVSYGGIAIPLSFSYSNQRISYGQPFNIVGLSPKYKWITTHLGYRSMTFSPYTLSGHVFLGVGVEIEPKKGWKSAAMFGRLVKALPPPPNGRGLPAYERFGGGVKTEYQGKDYSVGVSLFAAKDNANSIQNDFTKNTITPQQNIVLGLSLSKKLNHWSFKFDGARSALTRNLFANLDNGQSNRWIKGIDLIPAHSSTGFYNAYKVQTNYQFKSVNIGGSFEHVDPNYRTLGAYFFNNDLESIALQLSTSLFKNKISLSGNVGRQRNNLDKSKQSTMNRWVSAIQMGFVPNNKWNFNLSYSNFQSFTNVRQANIPLNGTVFQPTDTLNFVIVSESMQGSVSFIAKSTEAVNSSIMYSISAQRAAQLSKNNNNYNPTFYNSFISYNHGLPKRKMQGSIGLNSNISGEQNQRTLFVGPNASFGKTFLKDKLRSQWSTSWNAVWVAGVRNSSVYNLSWTNSYKLSKHHNFNCNLTYLSMAKPKEASTSSFVRAINEYTVQMGYAYTF